MICSEEKFSMSRKLLTVTGLMQLIGLLMIPIWGGSAQQAQAQVSLAPTSLFIFEAGGIGELFVSNRSEVPQEVNVRFEFQFPTSDAAGNISMTTGTPELEAEWGLGEMVRVFPRRLVLQAGETQTLRVQVRPMRDRPDGMFFTRAIVSSNALQQDVGQQEAAEGIRTQINYILEQSIPVFYRKGSNTTGVDVERIEASRAEEGMNLLVHLQRTGNSPFMGTMGAQLFDMNGNQLAESSSSAFFYFDERRRMTLRHEDLPPGRYRVELWFETQRRDMASSNIVQAPRITHSTIVEIP